MSNRQPSNGKSNDGSWVLIPIVALFIPLFAVSAALEAEILQIAAAVAIVVVMAAMLARMLSAQRHQQRLEQIQAESALASTERDQLAQANRIMDQNAEIRQLRDAISETPAPVTKRDSTTELN